MAFLNSIAQNYKEHSQEVFSFLKRCRRNALFVKENTILPDSSLDEVLSTHQVALRNFNESSNLKSTLSLFANKVTAPLHKSLTSMVEKQCALDEKILNKNSNFLGPLGMILFGYAALPVALISSSWLITAGIVSLFVGYAAGIFNYIYYKREDATFIHEYNLILTMLNDLQNENASRENPPPAT